MQQRGHWSSLTVEVVWTYLVAGRIATSVSFGLWHKSCHSRKDQVEGPEPVPVHANQKHTFSKLACCQTQWYKPVMPVLRRWKQADQEFRVILNYAGNLKLSCGVGNPISKTNIAILRGWRK